MKITKWMKRILLLAGLVSGLCFLSPAAQAANSGCTSSPDIPGKATLSAVAVDATLPVGSVIPGTERAFSFAGNCAAISGVPQGAVIITCYYGSGTEVAGMPGVYNTGVSGIGIALVNGAGQRVAGGGAGCDTRNTPLGYISNTPAKTFSINMTLELVKTSATVGSGSLLRAQTIFGIGMYNTGYGLGSNADSSVSYAGNIIYKSVSCSTGITVPVRLGRIPASDFRGVGSTSAQTLFTVPVTCDTPVNVSMSMSSPVYASKPAGVIGLTPATGNAGGVGIQMLYNNLPVVFDSYFPVGAIASAGATLNVPFTARYYQSAATVTPGIANATATFTLAYQ